MDCSPAAKPWGLRDLVIGVDILDGEGVGFFISLLRGVSSAIGPLSIFSNFGSLLRGVSSAIGPGSIF